MQSIDYCPPPVERVPDLSECGILRDFSLRCTEYAHAYNLSRYLETFYMCEFSRPMDDFYLKDGMIYSNWIVFFTCRPTDAERLEYIAVHMYPNDAMIEEYY